MSINDDAMADLSKLPDPDYIHVSSIDNPIGSGRSWKFPAMRQMLHRAESAEKQRDELLAALLAAVEWGAPMSDAPKSSRPEWFDLARKAIANAKGA